MEEKKFEDLRAAAERAVKQRLAKRLHDASAQRLIHSKEATLRSWNLRKENCRKLDFLSAYNSRLKELDLAQRQQDQAEAKKKLAVVAEIRS